MGQSTWGIYQNIKNLLLPSYTLQVNNMATTKSHSILQHLTIAILILAIWTGTTSAGQKCHRGGKKCVATKADGAKFTKKRLYILLGEELVCGCGKMDIF